ncbi:MAG TPA: D-aminoacylase [Tissierellia bacterium]|nr:D-aminoacylase [Tissierellia bacterium]
MSTYDIILKNARIVDGTGCPWYRGDVCIKDGKINFIGKIDDDVNGIKVIDVSDNVLSPGFIDIHCHYDLSLLSDPITLTAVNQGITTSVISHCGLSPAPIREDKIDLIDKYVGYIKAGVDVKWDWRTFGEYLNKLEKVNLGMNIAAFVGQGTIRLNVMGYDSRVPNSSEIKEMIYLAEEAMDDGAFGISTGLIYPPGVYSDFNEIVEITKVARKYNGVYLSHMRSETNNVVDAVKETIAIAEKANVPGQVGHHKACGKNNWGIVTETMELLEKAREKGIDMTVDQYPYNSASSTLRAILPPWAQTGGVEKTIKRLEDPILRKKIVKEVELNEGYENFYRHSGGPDGVVIVYTPETPEYEGKKLSEISALIGKDPVELALDIIILNKGKDLCCFIMMNEDDIKYIMKHPFVMIGSDSIPSAYGAKGHPRTSGTFPRVLGKYVREEKVISLEEAIRKMTSLPASRLNMQNKGLIKEGMDADIVIFNPDKIIDKSDFMDPFRKPEGIDYVIVNGKITIEKGQFTGELAGKVIRRK